MPATASPDDPELDPGQESEAPPKPKPQEQQPSAAPEQDATPVAPVMPTGPGAPASPADVERSFAAQGFGKPSANYKGPALAAPPPEEPPPRDQRYHDAYAQAQENWDANPDNRNRPNEGASGVEADLAKSRQQTEANLSGQEYRDPDAPPDSYVRQAESQADQEASYQQQQAQADARARLNAETNQREAQMRGSGQ